MKTKPIIFNWVQTGTNENEPILEVKCFGRHAKVFKAYDTNLWSYLVDGNGFRGIENEKFAKERAEQTIRDKINLRVSIAKSDLALLTDAFDA